MNFPLTALLFINLKNELQSILPTQIVSEVSIEANLYQPDDTKRTAVSVCVSSLGYDDRGGIERYRSVIQHTISEHANYHPSLARAESRTQWDELRNEILTNYYISLYYPNSELAEMA